MVRVDVFAAKYSGRDDRTACYGGTVVSSVKLVKSEGHTHTYIHTCIHIYIHPPIYVKPPVLKTIIIMCEFLYQKNIF